MILDGAGNPFYWHTNKARYINFNLPPGWYYCNVPIKKRSKFKPYKHGRIPKLPKRFLKDLEVFPLENPSKASISLKTRLIFADPKFYYNDYRPLKTFTLGHEVFHYVYHAKNIKERNNPYIREFIEMKCDNASKNWMLANGWNPTQVSLAVKLLLKGKNRKECIKFNTTHPRNKNRR